MVARESGCIDTYLKSQELGRQRENDLILRIALSTECILGPGIYSETLCWGRGGIRRVS